MCQAHPACSGSKGVGYTPPEDLKVRALKLQGIFINFWIYSLPTNDGYVQYKHTLLVEGKMIFLTAPISVGFSNIHCDNNE